MSKRQPRNVTITKQPGQLSAAGGYLGGLDRQVFPLWNNPQWLTADVWRNFVRRQPVAVLCREAITNYLISLDWAITARDSEKADELKDDIDYYTRLLERGNAFYTSIDFASHIEWIVKDLFDLPFGAACEIGRAYNSPDQKVVWIKPLDGGTLAPTLDFNYPVVQHYPNYQPVVFPKEFVSRIYLSPRTEIEREGWGMAPPERIYLAMEMLNRGDAYYAQLLLNTPEAGILDLGDTDMETATAWVKQAKEELFGINPMKIPVLAEHTTPAKWIPFGKNPADIMYNEITKRYITILCAGYGLTPSDIGMGSSSNGGETLAGTIRSERVSAKSGKALAKKKVKVYWENILPDTLQFGWVDFDDEKNVAMSRARMANANAGSTWIQNQVFSPDEIRRQTIADGLFTITLPETLDRKSIEWPSRMLTYSGKKDDGKSGANAIGDPKAISAGGQGEVRPQQIINRSRAKVEVSVSKAVFAGNQHLGKLLNPIKETPEFPSWEPKFEGSVFGKAPLDLKSESILDDTWNVMLDIISKEDWVHELSHEIAKTRIEVYNDLGRGKAKQRLLKQVEQDYIDGKRVDLLPSEEEVNGSFVPEPLTDELVNFSRKSLLEKLLPTTILVSEKAITGYKLGIDPTDTTDNNNIKLARSVSEEVYGLLPQIVAEVGDEIEKMIGENNG